LNYPTGFIVQDEPVVSGIRSQIADMYCCAGLWGLLHIRVIGLHKIHVINKKVTPHPLRPPSSKSILVMETTLVKECSLAENGS
jgi:hypothetical protein